MIIVLIKLFLLSLFFAPGVALSLYAWLDKNTFVEYIRLFRLTKFFYVKEFLVATENDTSLTYPTFLAFYKNNWLTRLLSCPVCCSPWFTALYGLPFYLYVSPLFTIPAVFFTAYLSLILYSKLFKLFIT